jgi:hypothetical protein
VSLTVGVDKSIVKKKTGLQMIDIIFTIDYELYGNGEGGLQELVYEPAEKLISIFQDRGTRFVAFIELAELEMIDSLGTDKAIDNVKGQLKEFYNKGVEIGLHLHPQWYGAHYEHGSWSLDYDEYNLCLLPRERIAHIIERSIRYIRTILDIKEFVPISFRAGNWLFKPTQIIADVLSNYGIRVDSSVIKGSVFRQYKVDYRRALRNGYYWPFSHSVESYDLNGTLIEVPIYSEMIYAWRMLSPKRVLLQKKGISMAGGTRKKDLSRLLDFLRLKQPIKLDYCRMTFSELVRMTEKIVQEDLKSKGQYKPIVAIGHTKELEDYKTIDKYLCYLIKKNINITSFSEVYRRCREEMGRAI